MERINGWQKFSRNLEWIFAPERAHERERLEKEAEHNSRVEELHRRLQTPEMKARVAQVLEKYNIVAHIDTIVVPPDGKEAKLLIEPRYKEVFRRIVRDLRPATVYYSEGRMDEQGLPGRMWIDEGEIRIHSDQYIIAMFGGVFDDAEEMGYRKIQDGKDFITQAPYGRFVQEGRKGK